ncbi:MAG: GNAT family N-acetyltransferase [Pseudomonadota bacterium]
MSGLPIDIPVVETERLRLRAPSEADLETEAAFFATDRSAFVGGPLVRDEVWRAIASMLGHWVIRGYGFWAVDEKETGLYCGRVGLWNPEAWPEPEIGWTLMEAAEGRGIALEAALAARRYAYDTLGWTTAVSSIDPDNNRSAALAARMGARYEYDYTHPRYGEMKVWRHPGPEEVQ